MKKIIFTVALLSNLVMIAQDAQEIKVEKENEDKGVFKFSGSVDTYYTTNLSTSEIGSIGLLSNRPSNGFSLGMANTVLSYEKGKTGAVADLAYGPRARAANMYYGAINQLYAYYQASESVKFTLGQFNTFLGYELISPTRNFNYSVSYLFKSKPFSHTGLKIDYTASKDLSFMVAVTNPHEIMDGSNFESDNYQVGFQAGYKKHYLNLLYGAANNSYLVYTPDGEHSVLHHKDVLFLDYTGKFDLTDSFHLGINMAYSYSNDADAGYQGVALYLQKAFSETFSLGLRPEFYTAIEASGNISQSAFTLAGNTSLSESLKLITELRYDGSDDTKFIYGSKENVTGLTIAAVYSF